MRKIVLLGIVLISIIACQSIGDKSVRKDPACPTCQKFEGNDYQKVKIVWNYWKFTPDEFRAYVESVAAHYDYTEIKYFWKRELGGNWLLRTAVIYYE